jgi:hypothetical protein
VELVLGLLMGLMMGFFLWVAATGSPALTPGDFWGGALVGFSIVAFPIVLISALSIRELNHFEQKCSLILNFINAAIVFCSVFIPVAIWQFYTLSKLNSVKA